MSCPAAATDIFFFLVLGTLIGGELLDLTEPTWRELAVPARILLFFIVDAELADVGRIARGLLVLPFNEFLFGGPDVSTWTLLDTG